MVTLGFQLVPSPFGTLAMVWQEEHDTPKVQRIFLPSTSTTPSALIQAYYPGAVEGSARDIDHLAEGMQRFLHGEAVDFSLDILALDQCSPFQQEVLLAEYGIPRGWVTTYGRIARQVGNAAGSRAVGRALARNPFPILIPCHRAILANGELGGFQGGAAMKRALLDLEGVPFSPMGRVLPQRVYY